MQLENALRLSLPVNSNPSFSAAASALPSSAQARMKLCSRSSRQLLVRCNIRVMFDREHNLIYCVISFVESRQTGMSRPVTLRDGV